MYANMHRLVAEGEENGKTNLFERNTLFVD